MAPGGQVLVAEAEEVDGSADVCPALSGAPNVPI